VRKLFINTVKWLENLPGQQTRPNFCCLSVTERCTLKCRMCFKWKDDVSALPPRNNHPTVTDWRNAIASIRKLAGSGFTVNFGGGEPFLMEELLELVRFAGNIGLKTNIATNAYLIDEPLAKAIAESGLTTINLSLDSFKDTTHDYLRGVEGVYKRVMLAVDYLDTYCPELQKGICCVISSLSAGDILELTERVQRDNRLDWIYFMAVMQPNNTGMDSRWYQKDFSHLWPQEIKQVYDLIGRLIELKRKGWKIVNHLSQLKAFRRYFICPERFIKISECNLSRAIHVSSVGDVFICFQQDKLGNITKDSIEYLWYSHKAKLAREAVRNCRQNCHFLLNCFFEGDLPFSI